MDYTRTNSFVNSEALTGLDQLPFTDDDFAEASRFLRRLSGTDPESTKFWFQTFDDSGRDGKLAEKMHGTLRQKWDALQRMQRRGAGVFVTVNASVGGRQESHITRIRAAWRDVDLSKLKGVVPAPLPIAEHMRVTTKDGWHDYVLTDAGREHDAEWRAVMEVLVRRYGADNNAKDLPRVLRVPGFWHLKAPADPFKIRLAHVDEDRPVYSWDEVRAAFPAPAAAAAAAPRSSGNEVVEWTDVSMTVESASDTILTGGDGLHSSLVWLAAHHAAKGMSEGGMQTLLVDLMDRSQATGDRAVRIEEERAKLADTISSAVKKFAPVSVHARIVAAIDSAVAAQRAPLELVDDVLGQVAAATILGPSQVEDIMQRVKKASGIGLRALREDLRQRNDGATGAGETHADFALKLLDSLTDESGEHPAVGVEGQLYRLGDLNVWTGRDASSYEIEVGRMFAGAKNCQRRGDFTAIAGHAYALAAQGREAFFDGAPSGVACADGNFYRLASDGELALDAIKPEHRQRFLAPFTPDPCAATPMFKAFLQQTFKHDDPAETQAQIELLQETFGAVLMGILAKHEKAALFYGPGRAGKGTVLRILEALVPEHWRAALTPFKWDAEYYLASLAGRRLNLVGELEEGQPLPAAAFKTVIGRDLLAGRQPSGRVFSFRNEAAHVFNSNYFVSTRDHSEAFFSRWIIIGFANSRLGMAAGAIDSDLAKKIVDEELDGIAFWAMVGAARLQRRGAFRMTRTHGELLGQWRRRTDSIMEFLADAEVVSLKPSEGETKRDTVYDTYYVWALAAGRKPVGKQKFYDALDLPAVAALGVKMIRKADARLVTGLILKPRVSDF